jgi:hypothetical protein
MMQKYKNKIVAAAAILVLLAAAWFYGGNYNKDGGDRTAALAQDAVEQATVPAGDAVPVSASDGMEIDPKTGKDKYLTDPVPEGKPIPVEPQEAVKGDGSYTVTLSVRCDTILDNMNLVHKEKHELVPADGVIFPAT